MKKISLVLFIAIVSGAASSAYAAQDSLTVEQGRKAKAIPEKKMKQGQEKKSASDLSASAGKNLPITDN